LGWGAELGGAGDEEEDGHEEAGGVRGRFGGGGFEVDGGEVEGGEFERHYGAVRYGGGGGEEWRDVGVGIVREWGLG
jgi:hypothetical protein